MSSGSATTGSEGALARRASQQLAGKSGVQTRLHTERNTTRRMQSGATHHISVAARRRVPAAGRHACSSDAHCTVAR
jgi:hypothetical protein